MSPQKKVRPFKKKLGLFEMQALADEHQDSPIYIRADDDPPTLDPWLLDLRFQQAAQVAQLVLNQEIDDQEFQAAWNRTLKDHKPAKPKPKKSPSTSNTATFGGYRLKARIVSTRDQKKKARPKKKK